MAGVFISYSTKDREFATYLASKLQKKEFNVFIDYQRLQAGASFSEQIRKQIIQQDDFIVIVSPRSAQSKWVQAEVNLAHSLDKPIIPIMLENISFLDSNFWFLSHQERVDFVGWRPESDFSMSFNKLFKAIGNRKSPELQQGGVKRQNTAGVNIIPPHWLDEFPILTRFPHVRSMRMLRPVVEGQSGSRVFIVKVDLDDDKPPMTCFLKIHYSQGNSPLLRHQQAYRYFESYMPFVVDATPWDADNHQIALLYTAQKTVDSSISLSDLLHSKGKDAYQLISKTCQAITQWNHPLDFSEDYKFTPIEPLFRQAMSHSEDDVIQYRRLEDEQSSVYARLKTIFDLDSQHSQMKIDGKREVLPNPLAYLANSDLWGASKSKPITWISGHIHGDLNARNILSLDGRGESLQIIDFDTYDSSNLIFLDYFQLELGIILSLLSPTESVNQRELMQLSRYLSMNLMLDDIPNLAVTSMGINTLLMPIRQSLASYWQEDEDLIASIWLARMAVGLEMSRKRKLHRAERVFALVYAAESLNSLLNHMRIEPDQYGAPINISWD